MRRTELDLCRLTACIMVLFIHTSAALYHICPLDASAFVPLSLISTMMRGGVPVFFMLTGALFLNRETLNLRRFLKTHVLRLILLFAFWSFPSSIFLNVSTASFTSPCRSRSYASCCFR